MSEQDSGGGFFTGFVIGGLIGAAVGVLLAPKSGQETVEEIRTRGSEWRARSKELLDDESGTLKETVADLKEILRETVQEAREVLKEAVEEGKAASAQAAQDLQQRFQEAREGPRAGPPVS